VFLGEVPRSRQRKRDIVLGIWKVRSLYRAGSLTAEAREIGRYKLDLVGVQEVRWDKGGHRPRRRWEDNIKMDLQEVGGGCGDWMELAQVRDRHL